MHQFYCQGFFEGDSPDFCRLINYLKLSSGLSTDYLKLWIILGSKFVEGL